MVMEMRASEFAGKRIGVAGMARTGLAAAPALRDLGADVTLSDSASREMLGEKAAVAQSLGVRCLFDASPDETLADIDLLVPSPGISRKAPLIRRAVQLGIPILSEIEVAYRIARAPMLAVTGTNGKTTTTLLLGEMMRADGKQTYVAGNIAADSIKLPLISAAMKASMAEVIVAEVSSFQLEWVQQFRPRVGILTNITQDHLDRHGSFDEYAACKARLFTAQQPEDFAVINAVNAPSRRIGEAVRSQVLWFDRGHCQRDNSACIREGRITVRVQGNEYDLGPAESLRIPGRHNLENALAAAAAALAFGVQPGSVIQALENFAGAPHRMESIAEIHGVLYINNSMCTNVDAAVRSLESMDRPTIVISGGVDKNGDFDPWGRCIANHARRLVVIGRDGRRIADSARSHGFEAVDEADTLEDAVALAATYAFPGDAVMLAPACASFDMFRDFEHRGEVFRQTVKSMIEGVV
jgi:UDP-N-acetylmuramoylalanine--D-glutamate ligase